MAEGRGPSHWAANSRALRRELEGAVDRDLLRDLHRLSPFRHGAVALGLTLAVVVTAALLSLSLPFWAWLPLSLLQGLFLFDFTILLHEVLHHLVFPGKREGPTRLLAFLYALPSGISPSQFTRWHLDHHAGLGSPTEDPKRNRLSPKKNARWLKVLYFTPALFWIYFHAAAEETATYEKALRRRITIERLFALLVHAAAAGAIFLAGGFPLLLRLYLVPYLFGFPLAFGLNRLGQHYDIAPEDPARWGTRMRPSRLWDAFFLWSSYHLEHHYFPGVPFYNLRRLNAALRPFFERRALPERSYGWLLWKYLAENRAPHTRWT
ncbi:MAG: fatty acid desaturase family protein [Acidobacteriota bacterium]